MHATDLIETNIRPHCQSIHKKRFDVLEVGVEAALAGRCVTVTGLGRRSPRAVTEKASIKQMDLLVGNKHLPGEAPVLYRAMARWIVQEEKRPVIVVDWSVLTADEKFHVLRASVPAGGRGKTLYQEVHPQEKYGSPDVQLEFLRRLAQVLPTDCKPVVVTDAGFKNPWFRAVETLGWDWIGRVRGAVQLTRPQEDIWLEATLLGHLLEVDTPVYMGSFLLAKTSPLPCAVYGLRKPPKGRVHSTLRGQRVQSSQSRKSAQREREPWVLVTSLSGGDAIIPQVIEAYTKRMQIEEAFRDTKDEYYGLGLNRSRSRSASRFTVLLLINALALFVAWLIGKVAELRELHHTYQANTERNRRVLSFVFLGLRVLSRAPLEITPEELQQARLDIGEALRAGVS
jgi:hypothetical protein